MADDFHPESLTAQGLGWVDEATRAINPPIHVSSTYLRDPDNGYRSGRVYMRDHNPAFDQAEALVTELEHGHQTLLFASGMAAATAVFQALQPGDHVLAPKVMYWSLRNWLSGFASSWGLDVELIDMTDPAAVQAAIRPGATKLVWVETPANPLGGEIHADVEAVVACRDTGQVEGACAKSEHIRTIPARDPMCRT
jgi:cystathionine gamma-synthase